MRLLLLPLLVSVATAAPEIINDGQPKGPLQMVVKNCVPADAIRELIGGE